MSGEKKLRVLFVISSLSSGGGAEHVFSRVINALSDALESSVLVFEKQNVLPVSARVYRASSVRVRSPLSGFRATLQRATALRRLVNELEPDVVIGTQTVANLALFVFAGLGCLRFARRCIVRVAYDPFEALKVRSERSYRILAFLECSTAVVLSHLGYALFPSSALKRKFVAKTPIAAQRSFAISNFCDAVEVRRLSTEPVDGWPTEPVIISVGRLDSEKNPSLLVKAFSKVRSVRACKLALVGSGGLEPQVRELAKRLGVMGDTIFLGERENPFKFVAKSSVFVLSSNVEGMPNALIEAMALGIPVIATDTDGSKEVLGGPKPSGIIVPRNDPESLAKAILGVQNNADLRSHYAAMAAERSAYFDSKRSIAKYLELFRLVRSNQSQKEEPPE